MIVEERIYTLHAGKVADYLRLYEAEGLPVQREYLPHLVGYYWTEFGPLNQVIHLWAYRDLEDRRARRDAMRADPRWPPYLARVRPMIATMENKLLMPASFFDLERQLLADTGKREASDARS
jgi:hypothetical protein